MTTTTGEAQGHELDELAAGIERTRSEVSATIGQIEQRLSPSELGHEAKAQIAHVEERLKAVMKEGLRDGRSVLDEGLEQAEARAKAVLKEGLREGQQVLEQQLERARHALKEQMTEAKATVHHGLSEARETLKHDLHTAIEHTKQSVRDATLGRVEDLATHAGDAMNDARDTLIDTIRQNPLPAALAGIGLAWLLMNRSSSRRRRQTGNDVRSGDWNGGSSGREGQGHDGGAGRGVVARAAGELAHRAGDVVHKAGAALGQAGAAVTGATHDASAAVSGALDAGVDTATHLAHDASDAAGRLVHGAMDTAGLLAHRAEDAAAWAARSARDEARSLEGGARAMLHDNPMALGVVALCAGGAVGYALPRTRAEDQLVGEVRDRLVHGAADMAGELTGSLHHLAEDAGEGAKKMLSARSE